MARKLFEDIKPLTSNQGGIERRFVDEYNFCIKLEYIAIAINKYCGCKCHATYCKTNNKSSIWCKPNTGMLEELLMKYVGDNIDYIKQKCLIIGDTSGKEGQFSDSDKITAENFRIYYMNVSDFVKTLL